MKEIYYCYIIYKESRSDVEKGDLEYVKDKDLPEIVCKDRFLKSDVVAWGEYISGQKGFFKNKEDKITVSFKNASNRIVLTSLDKFDNIMEEYLISVIQFKHN